MILSTIKKWRVKYKIAEYYTNNKYVAKTRQMGYNDQKSKCPTLPLCMVDTGYETAIALVQKSLEKVCLISVGDGESRSILLLSQVIINNDYYAKSYLCVLKHFGKGLVF